MSLLDLQSLEPIDRTGDGDDDDTSSLSLLVCDTHSSNSYIICL